MTDADYADDSAFLANTPEAESLKEKKAGSIDLYVNSNRIEIISFKRERTIFILSGKPLKLVDQFPYVSSSISSTESDVNVRLTKASIAIDWLLIIWKPGLFDKLRWDLFQAVDVSVLL